jgi:hypothetical protein
MKVQSRRWATDVHGVRRVHQSRAPQVACAITATWLAAACHGPNPAYQPAGVDPGRDARADVDGPATGPLDSGVDGADPDGAQPDDALAVDVTPGLTPDLRDAGPLTGAGLLFGWAFDEQPPAGSSSVPDDFGNTAVFMGGVTWSADRPPGAGPGLAPRFNGIDGHAELTFASGRHPTSTGIRTAALWFKYTGGTTSRPTLLAIYNSSRTLDLGFQIGLASGGSQVAFWLYGRTNNQMTHDVSSNVWHHVAVTFDGTIHVLFVDGVERRQTTMAPVAGDLNVGRVGTWNATVESAMFAGLICDLRLYNRVLPLAEIRALAGL